MRRGRIGIQHTNTKQVELNHSVSLGGIISRQHSQALQWLYNAQKTTYRTPTHNARFPNTQKCIDYILHIRSNYQQVTNTLQIVHTMTWIKRRRRRRRRKSHILNNILKKQQHILDTFDWVVKGVAHEYDARMLWNWLVVSLDIVHCSAYYPIKVRCIAWLDIEKMSYDLFS